MSFLLQNYAYSVCSVAACLPRFSLVVILQTSVMCWRPDLILEALQSDASILYCHIMFRQLDPRSANSLTSKAPFRKNPEQIFLPTPSILFVFILFYFFAALCCALILGFSKQLQMSENVPEVSIAQTTIMRSEILHGVCSHVIERP